MKKTKVNLIIGNTWKSTENGDWTYENEITGTKVIGNSYEKIQQLLDGMLDFEKPENIVIDEKKKILKVMKGLEK